MPTTPPERATAPDLIVVQIAPVSIHAGHTGVSDDEGRVFGVRVAGRPEATRADVRQVDQHFALVQELDHLRAERAQARVA